MVSFIFERSLNLPVEELWPILSGFTDDYVISCL